MKAPFPYFGGKRSIADKVWAAIGQPKHYIEPFFGSGAVLLLRPDFVPGTIETVCDKDGFIANVWRSLQFSPDETAKWCDWPVNHADLSARKKKLIENEARLLENLIADDSWHDPKMAGYWIWAASCWIGSGLTSPNAIPHIGGGMGIHAHCQIPNIGNGGMGIHAPCKRPHVASGGKGVHASRNTNIYKWFNELSSRLRYVRVVCGDWTRVCGGKWQDGCGTCGMFFDPPYGVEDRNTALYHHDSTTVAADVMAWVRERGVNQSYRIVLAGYEEYMPLVENDGWTCENWKAQCGYANTQRKADTAATGKENRKREHLYFSPHCITDTAKQQRILLT